MDENLSIMEGSTYWASIGWPSKFFAYVSDKAVPLDGKKKQSTCCFKLTSKDESQNIIIKPDTDDLYELEVHNVKKCICDDCL